MFFSSFLSFLIISHPIVITIDHVRESIIHFQKIITCENSCNHFTNEKIWSDRININIPVAITIFVSLKWKSELSFIFSFVLYDVITTILINKRMRIIYHILPDNDENEFPILLSSVELIHTRKRLKNHIILQNQVIFSHKVRDNHLNLNIDTSETKSLLNFLVFALFLYSIPIFIYFLCIIFIIYQASRIKKIIMEKEKKKIQNSFFDFIFFCLSVLLSFFRSIFLFVNSKRLIRKNYFFDFLDYIFRIWTREFWKKPTFFKFWSAISDFINFIFKKR